MEVQYRFLHVLALYCVCSIYDDGDVVRFIYSEKKCAQTTLVETNADLQFEF